MDPVGRPGPGLRGSRSPAVGGHGPPPGPQRPAGCGRTRSKTHRAGAVSAMKAGLLRKRNSSLLRLLTRVAVAAGSAGAYAPGGNALGNRCMKKRRTNSPKSSTAGASAITVRVTPQGSITRRAVRVRPIPSVCHRHHALHSSHRCRGQGGLVRSARSQHVIRCQELLAVVSSGGSWHAKTSSEQAGWVA